MCLRTAGLALVPDPVRPAEFLAKKYEWFVGLAEAEMQSILPKGRLMDVMVYVNMMKQPPVRMHKGQKIRSLD